MFRTRGPTTDWKNYGAEIVTPTDPAKITYAAAFVQGTDLGAEDSGAIISISHPQAGGFQRARPGHRWRGKRLAYFHSRVCQFFF
jgi:hypothetical protein